MSTFENIKKIWDENQHTDFQIPTYNHETFKKIVMSRTKKNINKSMQYFWGAFVLQLLVYGLLSNVVITHWNDPQTVWLGILGIALFIPFTVVLMKKFKRMAIAKPLETGGKISLYNYVRSQHSLLQSFYRFKQRYELILIPVSSAIGVFLTFKLWVPGGVSANPTGALITFAITVISCAAAIYSENRKNFRGPLTDLHQLLEEFEHDEQLK
jgi:hypothetical protein